MAYTGVVSVVMWGDSAVLVAYLIILREGIEAALIVGIVASYLKQTGRQRYMRSVWLGVVLAIVICTALGFGLALTTSEFPERAQALFEGAVAILATGVLTAMVFWMKRAARSIKAEVHGSIEAALGGDDGGAMALVVMAFFAVGREGVESAFFLLATIQQNQGYGAPLGALLGVLSAVAFGAAVTYGGYKLDLRRFFRWTSVLIVFVAAGLLAGALRSFHEAGLWNGLQEQAFDLGGVIPGDGVLGVLLTGLLGYQDAPSVGAVAVYLAFLLPALWFLLAPSRPAVSASRPA